MTNFEKLFDQALNNLTALANEYASDVVYLFCDKYGLRLDSFDENWCFYFVRSKGNAKYPGELVPAIEEYLKTGEFPEEYDYYCKEEVESHLEFLKTLPDEFWKQLEEIKAVENRLCKHENNISIFNNYIDSYGDNDVDEDEDEDGFYMGLVTLIVGEVELKLSYIQYKGKTVKELFIEFGSHLNKDKDHIITFVIGDFIVPDDTQVRSGETVRCIIESPCLE